MSAAQHPPKPFDEDDFDAFRAAMADVAPRPPPARLAPYAASPSARPRQVELDESAVLEEMIEGDHPETADTGDTLLYRAPGIQDSVLRRLRRGGYRIEAELDLHGLNRDQAKLAVAQFLARCSERDLRGVRVIHGKGHGSPNSGPVIKRAVDGWLRQRADVLAFCSARPEDGGTGAVYVLLRANAPLRR